MTIGSTSQAFMDAAYSALQFKASHNSYGHQGTLIQQLRWDAQQPHRGGCRGLELDIVQPSRRWAWSVQHGGEYSDEPTDQLSHHLAQLAVWSSQWADHDPITLHIDLKNAKRSHQDFPEAFDDYLATHLGADRILPAGSLLNGRPDLLTAVKIDGWPSLEELRGRFIVCLTGGQKKRTESYLATGLADRLCFCDYDLGVAYASSLPDELPPNRVFYNFFPMPSQAWVKTIGDLRKIRYVVIRGYGINDDYTWQACKDAGVNVLATDQVFQTPWAVIGDEPFVRAYQEILVAA